jgi:predicted GNAT family N-acyltransferase
MPYHETMVMLDGDLFVRKASVEYHASARYDDLCEVGIRCARIGNSSTLFQAALFRGETLLVDGELVYVFADPVKQVSKPVPPELRRLLEDFEAGAPMLDLRSGTWDELGREASRLRREVFVEELQIPAELEADAADANAVHVVVFNRFGVALATGRWIEHRSGAAQIGRIAVVPTLRGSGIGRAVLDALVDSARAAGKSSALLHAQDSAAAFYRHAGFVPHGQPFEEAGIPHHEMLRLL